MQTHEHLPPPARRELKRGGIDEGLELAKVARRDGQHLDCAIWVHKARALPKEDFRREVEKGNPEILLHSISRYYKFLPGQQQQAFLENLHEKAS